MSGYPDYSSSSSSQSSYRRSRSNRRRKNHKKCIDSSSSSSDSDCYDDNRCDPCEPIWPPIPYPNGDDLNVGTLTADAVYGGVPTLYVPSDQYPSLQDALDSIESLIQNRIPTLGARILLRPGRHVVYKNYNYKEITSLIIESAFSHPTLSNLYVHGAGHLQGFIPDIYNYYPKKIGGLGPWGITVCGNKITVCGGTNNLTKAYHPNFSDIVCYSKCDGVKSKGVKLSWIAADGTIKCFKVIKAECNSIWVDGCVMPQQNIVQNNSQLLVQPTEGEGFWLNPTTRVEFNGARQLLMSKGAMEMRALSMESTGGTKCPGDLPSNFLNIGVPGSQWLAKNCTFRSSILSSGSYFHYHPNISLREMRLSSNATGVALYQGFPGATAQLAADGAGGSHLGATFVHCLKGLLTFRGANISLIGCSLLKTITAIEMYGGVVGFPGTLISQCANGITVNSGFTQTNTNEFLSVGVKPSYLIPVIRNCTIAALTYYNRTTGKHDLLSVYSNAADYIRDEVIIPLLTAAENAVFGQFLSVMFLTDNIVP